MFWSYVYLLSSLSNYCIKYHMNYNMTLSTGIRNSIEQLPHLPHTQGSSLKFRWGSPPRWWWCSLCPSLSGGPGRRGTAPASGHPETAAACQTAGAQGDQCTDTVIHKLASWRQINTEDKNEVKMYKLRDILEWKWNGMNLLTECIIYRYSMSVRKCQL